MASPANLAPPPGSSGPSDSGSPMAAAPAPAQSDPAGGQAMKLALVIVQSARTLAQQFPEAAPDAAAINASVQKLMMKIAASQQTPESAAPPIG